MADESLATAVAKRLRNQPFLFVLGIAALLIGVLSSGAGFGTPELRIILAMIGGLAFFVVIGYYVLAVLRVRNAGPSPRAPEPVSAARAADLMSPTRAPSGRSSPSPTQRSQRPIRPGRASPAGCRCSGRAFGRSAASVPRAPPTARSPAPASWSATGCS